MRTKLLFLLVIPIFGFAQKGELLQFAYASYILYQENTADLIEMPITVVIDHPEKDWVSVFENHQDESKLILELKPSGNTEEVNEYFVDEQRKIYRRVYTEDSGDLYSIFFLMDKSEREEIHLYKLNSDNNFIPYMSLMTMEYMDVFYNKIIR
ncbi:hypothetical protein DI487_08475 [Flavobacterium sediminis]|uniref:Uncharacterized protein n=1 Tax=Flavobacterium sediminis TaxID=2201181 RepID=A0A2U8QUT6_9FLAO|nr:hypothetical protein [Flavobacterium sediminis]AWM13893.1 hypothetical protein DI487_08475 [Flavobacterium sediminis]